MASFDLSQYETVEERITKFYEKYPDGRIITELITPLADLSTVVFKASLYKEAQDYRSAPLATGFAFEREGKGMVNQTSHLENAETSAIGRALANADFAKKGSRPSREEMEKVARVTASKPPQAVSKPAEGDKEAEQRGQIREWLLTMEGGDIEAAKTVLEIATQFTGKDGNLVPGVKSVDSLHGKRLQVTYGKMKSRFQEFEKATEAKPEEADVEVIF